MHARLVLGFSQVPSFFFLFLLLRCAASDKTIAVLLRIGYPIHRRLIMTALGLTSVVGRASRRSRSQPGRPFLERLRAIFDLDNFPLPFVKRSHERSEEWVRGVILCTWGAGIILLINIILTLIAVLMTYTKPSSSRNIESGVVYEGSCSLTNGWETALHFFINVLSTGMLGASSYVMQCLCAPSRVAVDRAHAKNRWLDIGILSIRNFSEMDRRRKVLWVALLFSSLPIHMLFNSAVFSSITMTKFGTAMIPVDLAPGEPLINEADAENFWNITGFHAEDIRNEILSGALQNVSSSDCYTKTKLSVRAMTGLLLLVTDRDYEYSEPSWFNRSRSRILGKILEYQYTGSRRAASLDLDEFYATPKHWTPRAWAIRDPNREHRPVPALFPADSWLLYPDFYDYYSQPTVHGAPSDPLGIDIEVLYNYIFIYNPDETQLRRLLDNSSIWNNGTWARQLEVRMENFPVDDEYRGWFYPKLYSYYCLVKQVDEHCELNLNLPICLVVIACNMVKLICMYVAAKTSQREILLTVGDALASFLDHPDATTRDQCLMSRVVACLGGTIFASYEIGLTLSYGFFDFELGMGSTGGGDTFSLETQSVTAAALFANSPQLLASLLYYVCNGILSSMLAAAEYHDFALHRKPLRVSWPRGLQRSTYYLSVPWRYGIPLLTTSVTIHWLLSQTIFLSVVQELDAHHRRVYSEEARKTPTAGCSLLGILLTFGVTSAAMLVLFGLAFRPLRSHMPLAGTCSAALSAACHPPENDSEASLKAVMWGEVSRDEGGVDSSSDGDGDEETRRSTEPSSGGSSAEDTGSRYGHCTFTSQDVNAPSLGNFYR
ncbi:hypothetical protein BJX62DRAFT_225746 [Aspergillus germanicus]